MRVRIAIAMALALLAAAAGAAVGQELTVSVAISMKEAVEELQKQIEAGAPVDLFVSAAPRQLDDLERRGLIVAGSRRVVARNVLVAIAPADSPLVPSRPADLLDRRVQRIVIGNPRTVPVGQYTEESLRALGLWDRLQPKLVLAENVRQALDYVARGEVDAGFVYATDVGVRRTRVREAFRPPEETYGPVVYPVAVVKDSRHPALAQAFIDLLLSTEGRAILGRLGFQLPPAAYRIVPGGGARLGRRGATSQRRAGASSAMTAAIGKASS